MPLNSWLEEKHPLLKGQLIQLYWGQKLPLRKTAESLNIPEGSIRKIFQRFNIKRREKGDAKSESANKILQLPTTPTLAYLLGCLVGDGTVCKIRRSESRHLRHLVGLRVISKDFAISFAQALNVILGIEYKVGHTPYHGQDYYYVRCCKRAFYNAVYPIWSDKQQLLRLLSISEEHSKAFLRGMYESEGSCRQHGLTFSNSNSELADIIEKALIKLGYHPWRSSGASKTAHSGRMYLIGLTRQMETVKFFSQINPCIKRSPKNGKVKSLA